MSRDTIAGSELYLEAAVAGGVAYRVLDIGGFASGRAHAAGTPANDTMAVVIDPSSEGAVRALDAAGLDVVSDQDIVELPIQTRNDSRLDIAGTNAATGADAAEVIAFDLFFVDVSGVTVSPDGRTVYGLSRDDDAIAVFARDPSSDELHFVQLIRDGIGLVGLQEVVAAVVSPDGSFLYATSVRDRTITIFARDVETGELTKVGALDTDAIAPAFDGTIALDADGDSLYAIFGGNSGLATFERNSETGALQFLEREAIPSDGPGSLFVTSDGAHVYVSLRRSIAAYSRAPTTGLLTLIDQYSGGDDGSGNDRLIRAAVPSSDGLRVYAFGSSTLPDGSVVLSGSLLVFGRDPSTGRLDLEDAVAGPSFGRLGVSSQDGAHIYFSQSSGVPGIVGFTQAPAPIFIEFEPSRIGAEARFTSDGLAIAPEGNHLYASGPRFSSIFGAKPGGVAVFARNAASGSLDLAGVTLAPLRRSPLRGVRSLGSSTNGSFVHAVGGDMALTAFRRDPATGRLELAYVERADLGLFNPSEIAVSGDGEHVYVDPARLNFTSTQPVASFRFSSVEEQYELLARPLVDLSEPIATKAIALTTDGRHLYVAGNEFSVTNRTSRILTFERRSITGTLRLGDVETLEGFVSGLAISSDGAHVYAAVTVSGIGQIAMFDRRPGNGALRALGTTTLPSNNASTTGNVILSPDGLFAYLSNLRTIQILERDPASGLLTPSSETSATLRVGGMAISPDGRHLYGSMITFEPDITYGLVVYARDSANGQLSVRQVLRDGVDGIDGLDFGLDFGSSILVSADGAHVYVAASEDNAISVFARDVNAGTLTFVEAKR